MNVQVGTGEVVDGVTVVSDVDVPTRTEAGIGGWQFETVTETVAGTGEEYDANVFRACDLFEEDGEVIGHLGRQYIAHPGPIEGDPKQASVEVDVNVRHGDSPPTDPVEPTLALGMGSICHHGGVSVADPQVLEPDVLPDDLVEDVTLAALPWVTIVWNDPVNLMSYVTFVFREYFGYSKRKANKLMLEVHNDGKSVVNSGSREEMERDVQAMHEYGLWATLQRSE